MSRGTTRYTATGTTMSIRMSALNTGCSGSNTGPSASMPSATSGKIATQAMRARMWIDGGCGALGMAAGSAVGSLCVVGSVVIASAAGVNKERIYEHFGKMDDLFEAVLLEQLTLAATSVAITGTGVDAMLDYVGRLFDHHVAVPTLARLTAWEGLELGTAVGERARTVHVDRKLAAIRSAIPELSDAEARELMLTILLLVCGWQSLPNMDGLYRDPALNATERIAARRADVVGTIDARLRAALAASPG